MNMLAKSFYAIVLVTALVFLFYINSNTTVRGLLAWCQGCGHGGHLRHIKDWFKKYRNCPTGCGHKCEYRWYKWFWCETILAPKHRSSSTAGEFGIEISTFASWPVRKLTAVRGADHIEMNMIGTLPSDKLPIFYWSQIWRLRHAYLCLAILSLSQEFRPPPQEIRPLSKGGRYS